MDKILTIVIPTYNMEKYLRKCLDSLIIDNKELFNKLEVLVVIDGGKDSSSAIAHEYQDKYSDVFRVIDKENGNYGSCINRGLKEATGKYIKVLDADDYFDNSVFREYLSFLTEIDVDMILTDYNIVNEEGIINGERTFPYPTQKILQIVDSCTDAAFVSLQMHAVTYRLALLLENNYTQTEGVSYTDQEWVFHPVTFMSTFCYFPGKVYQYLVGRVGQTVDKTISSKQGTVRCSLILKRIGVFTKMVNEGKISERQTAYLEKRLIKSATLMYKLALIKKLFPIEVIEKFDKEILHLNKNVYDRIATSKRSKVLGIDYICYWRKHQKLPLVVQFVKFLVGIKEKLNE